MATETYSERSPAAGVDVAAVRRAAVREARRAYRGVVYGGAGNAWRLRRAVLRLALAVGNQSAAEEYLAEADLPVVSDRDLTGDDARLDAAELERAVNRPDPHPEVKAALAAVEAEAARRSASA